MYDLARQIETPSLFRALKASYGIVANPSTQARAQKLARTVKAIKPGVYRVGACIVSHWSDHCSCKQARANQSIQCAHKLAVILAESIHAEHAQAFFTAAGIEEPQVIATYARVKGHHGMVRIERGAEWYYAVTPNGNEFLVCPFEEAAQYISHVTPFYE